METLIKTLCDSAFADQAGKLNIIGVFDKIYTQNVPAVHPKMTLVFVVKTEPRKTIDHGFEIEDPSGKKIVDSKQNPNIKPVATGENGVINLMHNIINLKLDNYGKYKVILFAGNQKDSLYFEVEPPPKGIA